MEFQQASTRLGAIAENMQKVIVGKETVIKKVLSCMIAGGHVLLEDLPGSGKTMLAKSLAVSCGTAFSRIQFTPDLLPSDITGMSIYNRKTEEFVFSAGPVFTNVLLADEINRATPRTQAGLLECMEEKQVTTDGTIRKIEEPFFVIATQNPVETAGTFPLPEAQLDRFLMKLSLGYPDKNEEITILERFAQHSPLDSLDAVSNAEELLQMIHCAKEVYVHPVLFSYVADIAAYTRNCEGALSGVSTRAVIGLVACAKSYALISGRTYVTPDDIKEIAPDCLGHRLIVSDDGAGRQVIAEALANVTVPTEEWDAR